MLYSSLGIAPQCIPINSPFTSLIHQEALKGPKPGTSTSILPTVMANRSSVSVIAVLLAAVLFYYQDFLNTLYLSPNPKVVDSEREITYLGSLSSAGIEHFQNIFYAEEPTGLRRFAAPVPSRPVKGSFINATQAGAWCPQGKGDILPFTSRVTNISENCLSLRIARPAGTQKGAKLPVVVWIHGGKLAVCEDLSAEDSDC